MSSTGPSLLAAQVDGMMFDYKEEISKAQVAQINKKCFQGMGLTTCLPHDKPTDDYTLNSQMVYYREQIIKDLGKPYCLQCCGSSEDNIDHWNLDCEVDAKTAASTNLYGYEFKFARRQTLLDTTVISCPLRRTACQYSSSGETLSCTGRATDKTYLHGYYMKIWIESHSVEGTTWQGVYKCEVETYEKDVPLKIREIFKEQFELIHPPIQQPWDVIRVFVFLFVAYGFIYTVLYFCRRRHCAWCTKKLVFSKELCWLCKCYGVEPPDPFILQALEDKAIAVQGIPPERFPGSRALVETCRKFYARLPLIPNIPYIYKREDPIKPYEPETATNDIYADMISPTKNSNSKSKRKQRQHQVKFPLEAIYAGVGHHDPSHLQTYKEKVRKEIHRELGITTNIEYEDDGTIASSIVTENPEKPKSP
jgi:hypothetical protein